MFSDENLKRIRIEKICISKLPGKAFIRQKTRAAKAYVYQVLAVTYIFF